MRNFLLINIYYYWAGVRLLLHGLYAFGDDWESIRAHLLPNLTSKQIRIRFSNLKSRRYADNPVKDYFLLRVKPLTLEEEEVLRKVFPSPFIDGFYLTIYGSLSSYMDANSSL